MTFQLSLLSSSLLFLPLFSPPLLHLVYSILSTSELSCSCAFVLVSCIQLTRPLAVSDLSHTVGNATGGAIGEQTLLDQGKHLASSTLDYAKASNSLRALALRRMSVKG